MKFSKGLLAAASIAIAGLGAGTAGAETVNLTSNGLSLGQSPVTITYGTTSKKAGAGEIKLTNNSTAEVIYAFCVDVFHYLASPRDYELADSMFGAAVDGTVKQLFDTAYNTVTTAAQAAGFQMALWEIVTETDSTYDLAAGYFKVDGTAEAEGFASSYLAGLGGPATGKFRLTYLNNVLDDSQDLVTVAPVPLPAAGLMLIGGLAGLGAVRRRQKKA